MLRPDGWLRTGDGGWLDGDGYLTLVGRRTEMYLRGGYNVYPVEVERVVSELPSVSQVAVVSRPDPSSARSAWRSSCRPGRRRHATRFGRA